MLCHLGTYTFLLFLGQNSLQLIPKLCHSIYARLNIFWLSKFLFYFTTQYTSHVAEILMAYEYSCWHN